MDWIEVYDALGCLKAPFESRQHSSGMTNIENAPRLGIANVRRRCVQEWDVGGDGVRQYMALKLWKNRFFIAKEL